ncbi:MAG: hypothetical protein QOE45_2555 [Frankiaceae bacterium]|nr:hypothetical protein [Frankiaceae bacterium]
MTAPPPLAVQLWTLRDELVADAASTLKQVAAIGYAGVEAVLLPGLDAARLRALCDDLGLVVCAAHLPLPDGPDAQRVLDDAGTLGVRELVVTPGPECWRDLDSLRGYAERVDAGLVLAHEAGFRLGYHNHDWEFATLEGRLAYDVFLELVDPALALEVDLYWAAVAGQDLPALMRRLGDRVELLHVKDGPLDPPEPMVAVGEGVVDLLGALRAAEHARWHIVELDSCAGSPLAAVERSHDFLTSTGLSTGAGRG